MTTLDAQGSVFYPAQIFELLSMVRKAGDWAPGLCLRRSFAADGNYNLIRPDGLIVGRIVNTQREVQEKTMELPLYQSHKRVRAAKIADVVRKVPKDAEKPLSVATKASNTVLMFSGYDREFTPAQLEHKPVPEIGMYYIEYPDGYFSFSPSKEFEEGYKLLSEYAPEPPVGEERGYLAKQLNDALKPMEPNPGQTQ